MKVFGPEARGGQQRTGKKDDQEPGREGGSQAVFTKLPCFQLLVFHLLLKGHCFVIQPIFLYFLLDGFFVFMCLEESVHKKDVHGTDPCVEFFLLFILGFFFFPCKKGWLKWALIQSCSHVGVRLPVPRSVTTCGGWVSSPPHKGDAMLLVGLWALRELQNASGTPQNKAGISWPQLWWATIPSGLWVPIFFSKIA